jgi:hypothetical protein
MSTLRTTRIQHPSSPEPNITLASDGTISAAGIPVDTDELQEGSNNLYFTDERAGSAAIGLILALGG